MSAAWAGVAQAAMELFQGEKNRESAEDINLANANLQREFAQSGITWRVADAKRAGLHPLFALGASGAQASPSYQVMADDSISRAGQNLSRAATAASDEQMRAAQLEVLRAQAAKDNALAAAADSERARMLQESNISNPVAYSIPVEHATDPMWQISTDYGRTYQNQVRRPEMSGPLPAEVPPYLTPNIEAMYTRFRHPGGEMMLPSKAASEALEALENSILQAMVGVHNVEHYRNSKAGRLVRSRIWSDPIGALQDGVAGYLNKYRR